MRESQDTSSLVCARCGVKKGSQNKKSCRRSYVQNLCAKMEPWFENMVEIQKMVNDWGLHHGLCRGDLCIVSQRNSLFTNNVWKKTSLHKEKTINTEKNNFRSNNHHESWVNLRNHYWCLILLMLNWQISWKKVH